MKKRLSATALFTAVLLLGMLLTCIFGFRAIGAKILSGVGDRSANSALEYINQQFRTVEDAVSDNFIGHEIWVDLYGGIQRILGKQVVPDADETKTVVLGSDRKLYFLQNVVAEDAQADTTRIVTDLERFSQNCAEKGVDFLYVSTPHKYCAEQVELPIGSSQDYRETTEQFHRELSARGISNMDLMDLWRKESKVYSDGFFVTDHHWRVETAFWAFGKIAERLHIDPERYREDHFSREMVPNCFLGSMGTRVGRLYDGQDDIAIISPEYPTSFFVRYQTKTLGKDVTRQGDFSEVILTQPVSYTMYITSDNALVYVDNLLKEDGKRILLVKDSFGVPVAAWLSCVADEFWEMDLRYAQEESVEEFVDSHQIDTVIVLYNPEVIGSELFYNFSLPSEGK